MIEHTLANCFIKLSKQLAVNVFDGKDLTKAFDSIRQCRRFDMPIRIELDGKLCPAVLTLDRIFALIDGKVYRAEYYDHRFQVLDATKRPLLTENAQRYLTILEAGLA